MFLYLILAFFSSPAFANEACIDSFTGSQRAFQIQASRYTKKELWPEFTSIKEEKKLYAQWNKVSPSPVSLFNSLLPNGARFIDHRLRESWAPHLVKNPSEGANFMLRLAYRAGNKDLQTNVLLNNVGFSSNINPNRVHKDFIMGENVPAVVVFLHGGGTKSTGGHVAESLGNHFAKYKVGVFSPDLPWHGEGPRVFMGDLESEILALSALVKRYIHPKVPVFLWGHSWGASLADKVMQMSGEKEQGFFHNNLKGLIITSPAVDAAPGASYQDKKEAFFGVYRDYDKNVQRMAQHELNIFKDLVYDGKTSHTGGFHASFTISQIDQSFPSHGGDKYVPTLMAVGIGDPLVYVGFEEQFENYYGRLSNVDAHFLDQLPLIQGKGTQIVGHLLGNYEYKKSPVNVFLGHEFIEKNIDQKLGKSQRNINPAVEALNLYGSNFSFREYVESDFVIKTVNTQEYIDMKNTQGNYRQELNDLLRTLHPRTYLLNQFSFWIERLDKQKIESDNDFDKDWEEFKVELLKLKDLLSDYEKIINSLYEESNHSEQISIMSAFVTKYSSKEIRRSSFLSNFHKADQTGTLNEFWDKYFYLTSEQKQSLEDISVKIKEIEQKTTNEYIPRAEELSQRLHSIEPKEETDIVFPEESKEETDIVFPDIYYRWLEAESEEQRTKIVDQIIEEIKANVQLRDKKIEEISNLHTEMKSLIKKISQNTLQIEQYISQLKTAFQLAEINPPHSLKERYEQSHQQFEYIFNLYKELEEESNEIWLHSLENKIFDEKSLEQIFAPPRIKGMIAEFNQRFSDYVEDRRKLRKELVEFLKQGGQLQDKSYEKITDALYGNLKLYELTNNDNIELAKKEAQSHVLKKELALLINEYNDYLFAPPITYTEILSIKDIFNQEFQNTEIQRKHLLLVLTQWDRLKSKILPEIPE